MGKKEKGGSKGDGGVNLNFNKTAKFMVLDAPGVKQPDLEAAAVAEAVVTSQESEKQVKEGLQGRRAKASSGPRMDREELGIVRSSSDSPVSIPEDD